MHVEASKFESLRWNDEMKIISKRRKIEERREVEIIEKKKKALEEEINRAEEEEDEVDGGDGGVDREIERLGEEVASRIVADVQCPRSVLKHSVGK